MELGLVTTYKYKYIHKWWGLQIQREKSNIMIAGKYSPIYGDFKR